VKGFLISAVLVVSQAFTTAYAGDWKLSKNSDGVEVYTMSMDGSPVKSFKGVTKVKASLSSLVAIIEDVPEYKNWQHNILHSSYIGEPTLTSGKAYLVQKTPIISDRDMCAEYSVVRTEEGGIKLEWKEKNDLVPPTNYVRLPYFRGMIKATPAGNGEYEIIYQVAADPGGSVPISVANMIMVDIPFNTLKNLKTKVNLTSYEGKNRFPLN